MIRSRWQGRAPPGDKEQVAGEGPRGDTEQVAETGAPVGQQEDGVGAGAGVAAASAAGNVVAEATGSQEEEGQEGEEEPQQRRNWSTAMLQYWFAGTVAYYCVLYAAVTRDLVPRQ